MSNSSIITKVPVTGHDYASFASPLPHPGELLREDYLHDYDLTAQTLAAAMGLDEVGEVEAVLAGQAPITADFAVRLGKVFRQSPDLWMRMQASHEISKAALAKRDEHARIRPLAAA